MFNSTNGARPGAARAVLFLTDGITQYQYAKDEANNLGEAGVSLAIVEIDVSGNSTTKDQLNRLVTGPVCRNVLVLRSFASLEKNVEEIKHSLCNGIYVFILHHNIFNFCLLSHSVIFMFG